MKRKRAAFTLIETVFAVFILLLICQLAVCSLNTGLTMTRKMTKLKEDPGIPAVQLEHFLNDARLQTEFCEPTKLSLRHQNGNTYNLRKLGGISGTELVFGNESDLGYMPLFYEVRTVKFDYHEPLLSCKLITTKSQEETYYFLIDPATDEKPADDTEKDDSSKDNENEDEQHETDAKQTNLNES
ncbi:hypothetical protein [Lapidilactobacillus bayanensis]|uniref:hypothetical protein n=1 Tax=Lapidilactobacillus bayanensis TaxID=2485998 RepID=UPI000F7B6D53|nr:hypothetical protein [Lapidilactobacillus bayanensis]